MNRVDRRAMSRYHRTPFLVSIIWIVLIHSSPHHISFCLASSVYHSSFIMLDFDDICDAYCFQRELWPHYMVDIYSQVSRIYCNLYTRWDIPENELALITIDIWKHGSRNKNTITDYLVRAFGTKRLRHVRKSS